MKISERGLKLVKEFEGCLRPIGGGRFVPYTCPAGVLTLGWGSTNLDGKKFDKDTIWTKERCEQQLMLDMEKYESAVHRRVKVPLNQNQFDALVSFTYNCGEGNLAKSTLLRKLNARDYEGAARQFAAWNKGGGRVLNGLTRRRKAEADLFRAPVNVVRIVEPPPVTEPMAQQVDPPRLDRPSFFERIGTWVTAITGTGAAAFFTDWRVVIALVGSVAVVGAVTIWFIGPDHVRTWLREKFNR